MYIVNVDELPQDTIYKCGKSVSDWLQHNKSIPLLGISTDGNFCFAKTDVLIEVLPEVPNIKKVRDKVEVLLKQVSKS